MRKISGLLFLACLTACQLSEGDVGLEAERFAKAYFNCDFVEASKHCTAESAKWLEYAASNVQEGDLTALQQEDGAKVEIKNAEIFSNDTTAITTLTVRNYLELDSIESAGHLAEQGTFTFTLVKRDGKWLVRMGDLPQNEKQNHGSDGDE